MIKKFDIRDAVGGKNWDEAPAKVGEFLEAKFGPAALSRAREALGIRINEKGEEVQEGKIEEVAFYTLTGEALGSGLETPIDEVLDQDAEMDELDEADVEDLINTQGFKGAIKNDNLRGITKKAVDTMMANDSFLEKMAEIMGVDPSDKRKIRQMIAQTLTAPVMKFLRTIVLSGALFSARESMDMSEETGDAPSDDERTGEDFDDAFREEWKMSKSEWWRIVKRDFE